MVRVVKAVHGLNKSGNDFEFISGLVEHLKSLYNPAGLVELYTRFKEGEGEFDKLLRSILWRCLVKECGSQLSIDSGAAFKHPETFRIGDHLFVGRNANIQGRFDGRCDIGNHVWIGPGSFLDARDLIIEDHVGWGPGAKVLGSSHCGIPIDRPIIETDLVIKTVKICEWADIGTDAVLLPGVTIGKGAIIGAGSVVTEDVAAFSIVAGTPARFIRWRDGYGKATDGSL
ncbi:acyltransferase [Marinobacterium aestuariivivens]|uniref:Acyltransferase n=1 Tax=Marinobacterium aestuariivivens TaxID=1698799 RepID=A0ABW1ZTB1_9GAMM